MNTANTPSPNLAPPLWQLLLRAKTVVQQVRQGRSLSTALPPVPAELRAGVQALSFQTLRQMGRAQEVLARLAVDRRMQGRHLGAALLQDAVKRAVSVSQNAGVRALLVHALDERAKAFYLHHGFGESPLHPLTLMLPLHAG